MFGWCFHMWDSVSLPFERITFLTKLEDGSFYEWSRKEKMIEIECLKCNKTKIVRYGGNTEPPSYRDGW